jgi:hypothetical protein
MTKHLRFALVLLALGTATQPGAAQQLVTLMDTKHVEEAFRLAADEKAAARFLDAYVVQTRAGWGNGPLIGTFSTPFSRVVQAAVAARRKATPFGASDVPSELLAQELHVVATAQKGWPDDTMIATVQSVVLTMPGTTGPPSIVQPQRTEELTAEYRALYGIPSTEPGVVAIFPLTALTSGTVIRVTFDRPARGFTGLSMCRECVIPVDLRRVR